VPIAQDIASASADAPVAPGHKALRTLSAGPNGALVLAQNLATGREVVVKVFRPAVLIDGEEELAEHARRVAAFLAVAAMQQELGATARRWAPVHGFGPLPAIPGARAGAYYCTDLYPASADWLIRGHVTLNAFTLRNLIAGVLDALAEVRACCARGHGNLTPANVLLSGRDPRSATLVLTDPSPAASVDPNDDQTDDRWALGALIYALIKHKPVHRLMLLPIAATDDWKALGRDGEQWLSRCNRLLAYDPTQRPDLADLAIELGGAKAPKAVAARRWTLRAAVAGAALAACAGASLGTSAYAYRRACAPVGRAPWVRSLVAAMADPRQGLAAAIAADPSIATTLPPLLAQAAAAGVDPAAHPLIPTPAQFQAARKAAGTVTAIRAALDDHHWKLLADAQSLRDAAAARGWRQISAQMARLIDGLPPSGGDQSGADLRLFLLQTPPLLKSAVDLNADWSDLTSAASPLLNSADPAVAALASALKNNAAATVQLGKDNPALAVTRNVFYDLASFVRAGRTLQEYQAVCDGIRPAFGAASPPQLDSWLTALRDNYVTVNVDVSGLRTALAQDQSLLSTLSPQAAGRDSLQRRCASAAAAIQTIATGRWTQARRPQFDRAAAAAQSVLESLRLDLHTALVTDWLAAVQQTASPAADCPAWKAALSAMTADIPMLAADDRTFDQRRAATAAWLAYLQHLDGPIRSVARLPDPYAGAVQERRVHEIWAAIPAIDITQSPPDADLLAAAADRASFWSTEIAKFAQDFPLGSAHSMPDLAADDIAARWIGPSAPPPNRSFWEQQVASADGLLRTLPWMPADAAHLAVLDATAHMDRKQLTLACADPTSSPETAFISRLRLEKLTGPDAWPHTTDELQAAADWIKVVQPAAAAYGITDADLAQRQRQAWSRFVAGVSTPSALAAAVNRSSQFGISSYDDANAALARQPIPTYNLLIYRARQSGGGGVTADALRQSINQLPTDDQQLANAALPSQGTDEQIRAAINSNSWYRWPDARFAPQAIAPPAAAAQTASRDQSVGTPTTAPAGAGATAAHTPSAAAATAQPKPAAAHSKRGHHVPGAVDNVD
jgi:hypothetical protein